MVFAGEHPVCTEFPFTEWVFARAILFQVVQESKLITPAAK